MTLAKLLVAIGATTSGFHRGLNGVRNSVDKLDGRLGRLRRGFSRAGGAMVAMGRQAAKVAAVGLVALVLALGGVVSASIAYEDAFAGVRKTVDATEPELQQLSADIRQMATEIPIAATELAGLGETAGALGVPTKNIKEFIRVTALLGATTNVSSDVAADSLGRLSNILDLTADDYSRFGSALVGLGNAGASTEAEILEITKRMGSAGKVAGLTTPQIIGWASAIASVSGMEPERAGTSMQTFFLQVTKFASKSGKELKLLAKTAGVNGKEFKRLFAKDANAALMKFVKGLGKLSKAQKLAVIEGLGFNDSGITRALLGMAESADEVNRQVDASTDLWRENTAMTDEATKKFATTKNQLALLKNNLLEIAMTLGDAILPHITPLIAGLNDWITANHDLIEQLAGQFATGLSTVVGWISDWVDANWPLIQQVGTFLIDALKNAWIVLTTQVIPALVGKNGKGGIIPAIVDLGRQIIDWLVPKVQAFIDTMFGPGGVVESLSAVVTKILDDLLPAFGGLINSIFGGGGSKGLLPALGELISTMWGDGKGPLAVAVTEIGRLLSATLAIVKVIVDNLAAAIDLAAQLAAKLPKGRDLPGLGAIFGANEDTKNLLNQLYPDSKAGGGPLQVNRPTLVGEEGPEYIATSRSGMHVVPNGELGYGGGDTYNVTINNPTGHPAEEDIGFSLRRASFLGAGRRQMAWGGAR